MTVRFYLLRLEPIGSTKRAPKYLKSQRGTGTLDVRWALADYGLINVGLAAADVTPAQHSLLIANADVMAFPANLDSQIAQVALPQVKAALEALKIPGHWVTTVHTYRELLRTIGGLFQFAQRHHGLHGQTIVPDNIQLDLTWDDLPNNWRTNLRATADTFGYDYSQVSGSTPLRAILKALADQWGNQPIYLGGIEI